MAFKRVLPIGIVLVLVLLGGWWYRHRGTGVEATSAGSAARSASAPASATTAGLPPSAQTDQVPGIAIPGDTPGNIPGDIPEVGSSAGPSPLPVGQEAAVDPSAFLDEALPGRGVYAGAQKCQECHARKFDGWSHDWHARALSRPTSRTVVGKFNNAHYKGTSSEAWMRRKGSKYVMRTLDASGEMSDFPVQWLIGGKRMQDTVTVLEDGRWQVLPIYYHVTGAGAWVDYNETKQGPVTPEHPFFWTNWRRNANHECLDCHVTGLDVRYDRQTRHWTTEFVDAGVACESCHGPGARHSESRDPADIVHPGEVTKEVGLALCGQCHGPRNPLFPLLDSEHRFRPGQEYDEKYQALVVTNGRERSGDFFADGRPKSSSFEYQALVQSQCYLKGQATCLSCHTAPHDTHGANELKPTKASRGHAAQPIGDATCQGCHADVFAKGQAHTHHRSPVARSCVSCHMPKAVTGVLDQFADHTLDVPVPQNTSRHGVPNACNSCHTDQTPEQMADALNLLWPDASRRQARRILLADAIDEATAAQSFPALKAIVSAPFEAPTLRGAGAMLLAQRFSQQSPAILAPLLRDRYPLVR